MTGRVLRAEADIAAAARDAVRGWRDNGWTLPADRAEHVAAILTPARDLLAPQPQAPDRAA